MITFAIRFFFYSSISFVLLSIPVNKKPMFYYVSSFTAPILRPIFNSTHQAISSVIDEGASIGKQLFSGSSTPRGDKKVFADRVHTKLAAPKKNKKPSKNRGLSHDVSNQDKETIKSLFQ